MAANVKRKGRKWGSAVRAPSCDELSQMAKRIGFTIEESELKEYQDAVCSTLDTYDVLKQLPEPKLPQRYPRTSGYPPNPTENPKNGWCWRCDIQGATSGKLVGKTIAIKDNIPVAGVPLRNGSHLFDGYTPDYDATVVTRILDAGGCIIGKSTCENLCVSGGSFTSVNGVVTNPHDEERMAGGSSSGSAVLVASGAVDMALGCDQGGSIRNPAAACGLVGLKPTWGLVPYTGILSIEDTLDHVGPITRNAYDCALMLEVLAGYDDDLDPRQRHGITVPEYTKQLSKDLTGVKIGVVVEGFDTPVSDESGVDKKVKEAVSQLTKIGATVEMTSIPMHKVSEVIANGILAGGMKTPFMTGVSVGNKGYQPTSLVEAMFKTFEKRGSTLPFTVKSQLLHAEYLERECGFGIYAKCRNLASVLTKEYNQALERFDVLVMPTIPHPPANFPSKDSSLKELLFSCHSMGSNTWATNVTGHPALTINVGYSQYKPLPVGMMIIGKHFDESTVLKVAYGYEQLRESKQ
ncbi:amidase-like [Glandiceps talaboti]